MATDSTNLPQGETTTLDAGMDMTASGLDLTTVQEVANEPQNFVDLPKGNTVILLPVQPGQTVKLPTDTADGVLAKIGPEGNLALVVDGRTIILQGFLKANDQSPVKIVTNDGDDVNVADLIAATDPSLDIQTAAGPAAGDQGDTDGSGIYVPFLVGPGLGGIAAEGILDPTALQYRLIDDERKLFTREEDTGPSDIDITFDILGGIINEDDLPGDRSNDPELAFVVKEQGNDGAGNDPFDTHDREPGSKNNPPDDADDVDDNGAGVDDDFEPLVTVATVKVNFGPDVPGTLWVDKTNLPDGLKSEGEEITYQVLPPSGGQGNGIVGFVESGKTPGYQEDEDRLVFDIKVQEDKSNGEFHINFTLYDNIDNTPPDADKDGAADLLGADEQILDLPVKVTAKDSDGSTLSTIMHLGVEDDIPFFGEVRVNENEEGLFLTIEQRDADITHDETKGVDGDADDQLEVNAQPWVQDAENKVAAAGFGLPEGDSEGALTPIGVAQTQVMASFGADQATQEYTKDPAGSARNSVFGELEDISNRDGDNTADGENERPFELYMTVGKDADGAVETHYKNPGDTSLQTAYLSIADQATNTTVTWNGQLPALTVYLHQVDAQTIIGYVIPPEGEESNSPQALVADIDGVNGEAVFVLTIDDQGVMTFVQYHQLNHPDAGDGSNGTHDEPFQILAEDGSPLINVRISDFDGDHASQPVNLVVQDDGPKFVDVEYDLCQTEGDVQPTAVHEHFDDLSGWTVLTGSNAQIVGDIGTSDPQPDPANQALLIPGDGDADQTGIESFFGLASGALDGVADDGNPDNGVENPTDGSAIKKTFDVHEGDTLTVKFNFLEEENDGGEGGDEAPSFQDLAFIVIGDQVIRLSNVGEADLPSSASAGSFSWDEESGYLTFTYTFTQSGPVQIGFGVMNEGDTAVDPGLLIDELTIHPFCEGAIDEDALPNGIEGGPGDGVGGTSVGGHINFDFGVDRPGLLSVVGLSIADDKGAAIAFEDLKTADGNGVEWGSKSGPDADGWVTWTAVEEGTGDPVFVFKLDTSGAGQGDFSFELKQALEHPFTDDPADPSDTNTAWEDNLHFNFDVKATDIDGDWTTGKVAISVDDDSPKFCGVDWGCDNDSKYGVGLIDEDKLDPNGNHDWAPGDDKGGTHADGTIDFHFGADQPGTLTVAGLIVKDCANPANTVLEVKIDESGNPVLVSGELHTADGQLIEIVKSGPDADGIVTWQGIVQGTDLEAFKLTIDTAGDNIGDFDFCLSLPLQHPYHDSDSKNDGPEKSFEDNLKFDFTIIGTDADGDAATGHIKVNVDDDSPKAECDIDCVTEGKTDGELNFATGNVVTGNGDTIFGDDDNNLDGNQDHPGADQPYTISKLDHCGDCYLLVQDEEGNFHVEKNGAQLPEDGTGDANFDPATGILHIPTHEGGTLDIVLVSDVQSEVGDYKYTVPADAEHDHTILAGPVDLAQSVSGAFDTVGEWTSSFASKGITIQPINGSHNLDIKNINVAGGGNPDYRGIGVENFEGDEVEVDRGGNEGLQLNLASDVNNIALTIGALFDGTQYDNGHQEILEWKIYDNGSLVGSGQILGTNGGIVTLDIDSPFSFDRIELKPVDNGQGSSGNNSDFLLINAEICCPKDKFTEEFEYTLRDADGDESSATLKVDVKDTEPTRVEGQDCITWLVVDEDGLPTGVGNTDSPADNEEDHNAPNAPVDDAVHFGTIPFTPGADPTSIELRVLGGPDTGMKTLDNQRIFAAWDATLQSLIGYIEGTDPNDAANQVFKMTVTNPLNGSYTFELLQPVKHHDFGNTENLLNTPANFIVVAEIEDKDCDVLYSKVLVSIDDDMPVITECHDEQGNDINLLVNGGFENIGGPTDEDGGVLDRGSWGVFSKIPGWTSGHESDSNAAGVEIQNNAVIAAKEGNNYVELDSDTLNPGDPAPTSTNASIYQDVETVEGNNYVLSFSYSPRVGVESSDGIEVWFDGVKVATIDSGKVGEWKEYTFVVEAGEGDGTPDASRLEFKAVGTADSLGGFIDDVSLTACALVDEDALPNGIEGGPGDDGPIGACFSGSLGVNFGADGGKSIAFFGEDYLQPNLKSHGQEVNYEWVSAPGGLGTLIAYIGGNPFDASKQVFTVEVQSLDNGGEYKFTLLKPLDHPDSNDNHADDKTDNGTGSFEDNLVFELKFKATDRDDDTVTGHLKINVDDDSPKVTEGSGSISLHTDETLGGGADVLPNPGTTAENDEAGAVIPGVISAQVAGTVIGFSQGNAAGLFNAQYGADGPGSTAWSLTITGGGATGLIDTATNTAITLVAGLNGVVLGKAAGGEVVFAFSIDGSGNVTMVQYRAVNHGANEAAPGDHDEAIFMNSGVLGVTVKVTDFDGDAVTSTRDISGSISIDDDGPHATCDYDSVTEGAGHTATGNVVSGANPENPDLGTDANGTDGNADQLSQDTPHTISKLTHGGHEYTLSADGLSVSKDGGGLGAGESFAGGKLTITTAEGATFEIIMVSSDPADVGEYRYTAGPNPIHAEDVHVGPVDIAATRSAAFDSVGEWQSAFTTGGINLVANGGSLAIKNVDVDPKAGFGGAEDYRGIGVDTGLDNAEVDTQSENLTLEFDAVKFPGGVNNAELLIGALFNGVQFDSGNQEILKWEAYDGATLIASGLIVGDHDGLVTLDIDTASNFNKIVLTPLNNGAGNNGNNSDFLLVNVEVCEQEPVKEVFGYTLRDGDGDESSASLKITVEDTYPQIPHEGNLCLSVDEDGLPAGIGNSDSPFDAPATSASASGFIPFAPGADSVTIELSVGNGGDTGLKTLANQTVLAAWDAATSTLIGYIAGTDPSDAANQVFKMTVTDPNTGAVTFDLLKPIQHANTDQGGDNTENLPDPTLTVNVQIEDKDCDVAFTTVHIKIDDDMPVIGDGRGAFALAVDESLDGNTIPNNTGDALPNPGTRIEDDEDGAGLPGVLTGLGAVIGASKAGASGLFSFQPGADGLQSAVYSLTIGGGGAGPVATNLVDTQDGTLISLFTNPDGTVRGISAGGHLVFAFSINAGTGEVSMVQYRAINHGAEEPAPGNHDEEKSLGAPSSPTAPALTNLLSVTLTVTDKDNDTVSKTVDITNKVTFDDDGPSACIDKKHDNQVIHDESAGLQNDDQPNGSLPGVFSNVGLIGWAHSNDPVVTTVGSDYGTDGAGTTVLSLKVSGAGVDSGLDDTATGNNILLFQNGSIVEGRVQGSNELVFAVSINQDGTVDVAQYRAIEHPNPNDHDEDVGISQDALLAVVTITDKDGDSDTASVGIGSRVRFDDDGPVAGIDIKHDACIVLDESKDAAAGDGFPDGNANDEAGNLPSDIAYGTILGSNLFVDSSSFGTDGPGTKSYSLVISSSGTNSGLVDSETNAVIRLYQVNATTIEGRPDVPGTDPVSFRVTIDPVTGNVTVSQFRAVEHDNAGSSASDHDESGSPEIMDLNKLFVRQTITDGDKDHDTDDIDLGKIIKFEDDGPIARNDIDSLDPAAGNTFESKGNVITGAGVGTPGIDDGGTDTPWSISAVQGTGAPDTTFSSGKLEVNGNYGKLFIDASGNYTYDFDEANTGKVASGSTEVFTYTLRDSDGDTDPATLTIKMGEATVETSAVVNPETGACVPEDTYAPIALTAAPGTGDVVTQITLTNVPNNWDVSGPFTINVGSISGVPVFDAATHSITFNITGAPAGTAVTINALIKGAPDSDVNGTDLTVGATVVDGVVFAKDTTDFNVIIDSVADGDDKGDDGDSAKLSVKIDVTDGSADVNSTFQDGETGNVKVTASYDDFQDGSETHTLKVEAPTGFTFDTGNVGTLPAGVVLDLGASDSDTLVFKVDSKSGDGQDGVPSLELNIPVVYGGGVDGKVSGDFTATVTATETPTDSECNDTNNTDSATATDKADIANPPKVDASIGVEGNTDAICIPEDSPGVDIPVKATSTPGSHLVELVVTGIGNAWSFIDGNAIATAPGVTNFEFIFSPTVGFKITFDGTVNSIDSSFKIAPTGDSDIDLGTLTVVATAADDGDPTLTATDTDQTYLRVDAIADGKDDANGGDGDSAVLSVSLTAADDPADLDGVFSAGEKGQLKLGATFDDFNDGSELHQITITAPAGFQFTGTISGLPAGVTVNTSNASTIVLDVDSSGGDGVGTIANVQIEIQNVGAPDSVTLDFTATASAVEQNTTATNDDSNKECTDGNNSQSVSATAAVTSQTDKLPIAYDDKVCGDEAAPRNVNVLLILDRSGSMGDVISTADGDKTRLQLLQEATAAMLNTLAENGDVRVMVVGFTTTASSNNQWVDVATAIGLINALTPASLTNYEDALDVGADAFNQDVADRGDFADHDNLVFFMSDGIPTTGGTGDADGNHLTDTNKQAWDNFLENPGNSIDQLTVVGVGADIAANDDDLEDVADPDYTPGDIDAKNPFGQVIVVADENDLKDALGGAVATAKIEGNVLDGSIENDDTSPNGVVDGDGTPPAPGDADNLGDTPTIISQFKYDAAVDNALDITINYDGTGDVELVDISGGKGVSIDGTKVSFDADYGRMTFDFSTGKFTFLADSIDGGGKEEHFNYTLKDTDGDVDSANLVVCIQDKYVDLQPIAYDNHDALTESSVSGAVTVLNDFNGGATGGTTYGGAGQTGGELVLTTSGGGGAASYASIRTSLIAEGLSGAALDALVGDQPNEGGAFVRPISVAAPSVLRFEYDYNGNSDGNDIATYFVLNSSNQIVAQGVLGQGDPDVVNGVVTVPLASAGNYKVIFTVNDREDSSGVTTLDIDRIETQPATIHTVSGNVITDPNDTPLGSSDPAGAVDDLGDGTNRVSQVQFGSTIVSVPSDGSNVIVTGANGILTINSTGAYTYVSIPGTVATGATETDAFTYTLRDTDGDTDTAILRIDSNGVADPIAPVAADDRIFTNIGGAITVKDSWLLKNDTDADTSHASLVIASVVAGSGQATFFENGTPAHAGTDTTIDLKIGSGGSAIGDGETTSFDYVVADPSLQDTGNAAVKYDISGPINGSGNDDILIGLNAGLQGGAGNDQIVGTGTADLLDYSNINTDWSLTLGAGGAGTATIDGTDTYEGIDGITGGSGKNTLTGNTANNILDGGAGDDTLDGAGGTDTFNLGSGGNDTINYTSKATLNGGDVVNGFDNTVAGGHDTINLDLLLDDLGVSTVNRATSVSVVVVGANTELRVDTDGNGSDETTVLTFVGINSIANFGIGNSADDDIKLGAL